jgi:NAD(P)-dependent dehydrogenase (short-subunit alcohol dehydrogenase family)
MYRQAYGQSKLANILFTYELARRLQEQHSLVTANVLHPGFIATDLMRHLDKTYATFGAVGTLVGNWVEKWFLTAAMSADDGALTQVELAVFTFSSRCGLLDLLLLHFICSYTWLRRPNWRT